MKKLLVIVLALIGMQLSAQDLNSLSSTTSSESSSMIDKIAGDQVKKFAKKLNLNESQQKMASDLVVSQLKSPKFQKLIGDSASKLLESGSSDNLDGISRALLDEPKFQNDMKKVLDDDQKKEFSKMLPI
ncbi:MULTISPECIES: hypothetical protein [Bizionia]|uniref:DUF4168 domain-containing protein n=1 Tax=Bizionia algoritergicola TaxID=291187 RepID=A0A5D0QVX7_9FLAO|nr:MULTISPECIES: hypothetical protein [Bizionia]OBX21503.1 hypothetical protein BAA08_12300 [Bizionia sp. APA-3]TYB72841.1 hypothetical protein ES675_09865 [Bizionia algoritergicola]